MSKVQWKVATVLSRMLTQTLTNEDYAETYRDTLETMLNDLSNEDVFGTEGQDDPRGDQRNDKWSMNRVEGIN